MTRLAANPPADSVSVRRCLTDALRVDLVGPRPGDAARQHERLPQAPSRWYLTGFLAPSDAPEEQRAEDAEEALDEPAEPFHGSDDAGAPDRGSGKRVFLPSSLGLSVLVDDETRHLDVTVSWGDYVPDVDGGAQDASIEPGAPGAAGEGGAPDASNEPGASGATGEGDDATESDRRSRRFAPWVRRPRVGAVAIDLDAVAPGAPTTFRVRDGDDLAVVCLVRPTRVQT